MVTTEDTRDIGTVTAIMVITVVITVGNITAITEDTDITADATMVADTALTTVDIVTTDIMEVTMEDTNTGIAADGTTEIAVGVKNGNGDGTDIIESTTIGEGMENTTDTTAIMAANDITVGVMEATTAANITAVTGTTGGMGRDIMAVTTAGTDTTGMEKGIVDITETTDTMVDIIENQLLPLSSQPMAFLRRSNKRDESHKLYLGIKIVLFFEQAERELCVEPEAT